MINTNSEEARVNANWVVLTRIILPIFLMGFAVLPNNLGWPIAFLMAYVIWGFVHDKAWRHVKMASTYLRVLVGVISPAWLILIAALVFTGATFTDLRVLSLGAAYFVLFMVGYFGPTASRLT